MKRPNTPLKKADRDKLSLKGWILGCLEDSDVLDPMLEKFDDLVLRAAGEAISIVMQQDDVMTFLTFGGKRLEVCIVLPMGDGGCGQTEWKVDFEHTVLEETELLEDEGDPHQRRKVLAIRKRLQHLVEVCDKALNEEPAK